MINGILKFFGKTLLQGVLWVFILSISIGDRILFDEAHALIIQNELVSTVDEEIGKIWVKISDIAKTTMLHDENKKEKTL